MNALAKTRWAVPQRPFRLGVSKSRQFQDRQWTKAGRQRRQLLLHAGRPGAGRRGRPRGRADAAARSPLGRRDRTSWPCLPAVVTTPSSATSGRRLTPIGCGSRTAWTSPPWATFRGSPPDPPGPRSSLSPRSRSCASSSATAWCSTYPERAGFDRAGDAGHGGDAVIATQDLQIRVPKRDKTLFRVSVLGFGFMEVGQSKSTEIHLMSVLLHLQCLGCGRNEASSPDEALGAKCSACGGDLCAVGKLEAARSPRSAGVLKLASGPSCDSDRRSRVRGRGWVLPACLGSRCWGCW